MTKPVHRSSHVQQPKPALAQPQVEPEAPAKPPVARNLALFLWTTAFGFLLIYELLSAIFKVLLGPGSEQ